MEHINADCTCEGKICTKCKELYCLGNYAKDRHLRSGLMSKCRKCSLKDNKEWRQKNSEHRRKYSKEYNKEYYKKNIEKMREQARIHQRKPEVQARMKAYRRSPRWRERARELYYRNHEKIPRQARQPRKRNYAEEMRRFRQSNPERARELERAKRKLRRERHPERVRELRKLAWQRLQQRGWKRKKRGYVDPTKHLINQARRRARKKQAGGSFTPEEWEALKAKYDYTCLWCRRREPEIKLHADHIVPIFKHGHSDISNIQPLCRSCNSRKRIRVIDFRPLWGLELPEEYQL